MTNRRGQQASWDLPSEPRNYTPIAGQYTIREVIEAGLAALPHNPGEAMPTADNYIEPMQFRDQTLIGIGQIVRPEPCSGCDYVETPQREPFRECQSYGVQNNRELAERVTRLVAPHWRGGVLRAAADQIAVFFGRELTRMWDDVVSFHHKYRLEYGGPPRVLPEDLMDFRIKFLEEELNEYKRAWGDIRMDGDSLERRAELLDALVDLVYVAFGTAYLHGFNFAEAWRRVQRANMSKVRVESASDSKRGSRFDVKKPDGWKAPNHLDLVGTIEASAAYEEKAAAEAAAPKQVSDPVQWSSEAVDPQTSQAPEPSPRHAEPPYNPTQHDLF